MALIKQILHLINKQKHVLPKTNKLFSKLFCLIHNIKIWKIVSKRLIKHLS